MIGTIKRAWRQRRQLADEKKKLSSVAPIRCDVQALKILTREKLRDMLTSKEIDEEWEKRSTDLETACRIEDGKTGGVNPGDRRAVYYLIRFLHPETVLEIGTHVGASTLYMAAALKNAATKGLSNNPTLTTVDIQDVNDDPSAYWKTLGLAKSPREMTAAIECGDMVRFIQNSSLAFFKECKTKFDFIFLDGDHSASTVYQEVPHALSVLNNDGVILIHDYFPCNQPLWSNGTTVPGPFMAVERLIAEGAPLNVSPLGELPWRTKLNSHVTSLAILSRTS